MLNPKCQDKQKWLPKGGTGWDSEVQHIDWKEERSYTAPTQTLAVTLKACHVSWRLPAACALLIPMADCRFLLRPVVSRAGVLRIFTISGASLTSLTSEVVGVCAAWDYMG